MKRRVYWIVIQALAISGLIGSSVSAEILKTIQKRGTVRIGVKNNLPLLGYTDQTGTLTGFEIELAERIRSTIWGDRIQIEYVPLLNQSRLAAVTEGTVDFAIANIHITESRRRVVHFSLPYLRSQTHFVTHSPTVATLPQLTAGRVGVLQGSVAIGRLQANLPNTTLVGLNSYEEAQQQLISGEIDSFAGDRLILRGWQYGTEFIPQSNQTPEFNLSTKGFGLSQVAIAMPKGLQHRNLHDAINLAIDTLDDSGELQQMRNKWRLSGNDRTALDRLDQSIEQSGHLPATLDQAPNVY